MNIPAHLTNAELALTHRNDMERSIRELSLGILNDDTLVHSGTALTAALFPIPRIGMTWTKFVGTLSEAFPIPRPVQRLLLGSQWSAKSMADYNSEQFSDVLARAIATTTYNTSVLSQFRDYGLPVKMWITRQDPAVRMTHREAHEQTQKLSEPFRVGKGLLQAPGDNRTAPIEEWAQCRCVMVGRRA